MIECGTNRAQLTPFSAPLESSRPSEVNSPTNEEQSRSRYYQNKGDLCSS
jgi:hypothetical protein